MKFDEALKQVLRTEVDEAKSIIFENWMTTLIDLSGYRTFLRFIAADILIRFGNDLI